nr:hypothetical protein VCHA53O474_30191 [Vibrio chagasii]
MKNPAQGRVLREMVHTHQLNKFLHKKYASQSNCALLTKVNKERLVLSRAQSSICSMLTELANSDSGVSP